MKKQVVEKQFVEFDAKYFTEYGRTVSKGFDFIFAVDILIADSFALGGPKQLATYTKMLDKTTTVELLELGLVQLAKKLKISGKVEKAIKSAVAKQEDLEIEFMAKPKWKTVKSKEENKNAVAKLMEQLAALGNKFEEAEDMVADLLEEMEFINKK